MKMVFPLLVLSVAVGPVLVSAAPATTAPADEIVEVQLEDPIKSQSKSYFDFDKGKTFEYGASTPEDLDASRRWLRDSGADLMCESRSPADGFVAYDMVLVESDAKLDELNDFPALSKRLEGVDAKPFDPVSVGLVLPRTYLFRTREGEVGGLEISSIDEKSRGLLLRYKLIHQPAPEQPQHVDRRGGRPQPFPLLIQQHKTQLKQLQAKYLGDHPAIAREKRQIKYLEDMNDLTINSASIDRQVFMFKRQKLSTQLSLDTAKDSMGDNSPTVRRLRASLDMLDLFIKRREAEVAASTQPSKGISPATRPVIFVQ